MLFFSMRISFFLFKSRREPQVRVTSSRKSSDLQPIRQPPHPLTHNGPHTFFTIGRAPFTADPR